MENITSDSVFLHRCHLLEGEPKGIYHKHDLPCIEVIHLVQFDSDDEECK
jgi:hypothetical protein